MFVSCECCVLSGRGHGRFLFQPQLTDLILGFIKYKTTNTVMVLFESWKELLKPKKDKMSSCVFSSVQNTHTVSGAHEVYSACTGGGRGIKRLEREVTTQFCPVPR